MRGLLEIEGGGRDLDLLLFLRQIPATSRETDLFERGKEKKKGIVPVSMR